jgi:tRNA (guanine26-N2/guanine27-N2)-dimethyltransferase
MSTSSSPYVVGLPGGVPSTHREHTESRTTILLPNDNTAFLNPPQQFNRDLSVAVIRAWNEQRIEKAKAKQEANAAKGKGKNKKNKARAAKEAEEGQSGATEVENGQEPVAGPSTEVS